jgi:flagellar basal body-associated protein FliL
MDDIEKMEEEPEELQAEIAAIEEIEEEEEEVEEEASASGGGRSWLTIALVGVVMLLVGALLGYFGRGEFGPEAQAAKATEQAQVALAATQAAANADLMTYLADNARNFKGDPNAAVTIIEFSDFQ